LSFHDQFRQLGSFCSTVWFFVRWIIVDGDHACRVHTQKPDTGRQESVDVQDCPMNELLIHADVRAIRKRSVSERLHERMLPVADLHFKSDRMEGIVADVARYKDVRNSK
jgi:hypothetical protein